MVRNCFVCVQLVYDLCLTLCYEIEIENVYKIIKIVAVIDISEIVTSQFFNTLSKSYRVAESNTIHIESVRREGVEIRQLVSQIGLIGCYRATVNWTPFIEYNCHRHSVTPQLTAIMPTIR